MADPYSAAARGIESGFGMAMRAQDAAEQRRRTQTIEAREAEEMRLRRSRDDREERRLDRQERRGAVADRLSLLDRGTQAVQGRQKELIGLSTAAQTAGQPVDPALADEYGRNAQWLARTRQSALDFFSRAQTGQIDPLEAPDDELYMHWTAATGMRPEELPQAQQGVNDVQAGLETGNQGLLLQGVNRLMAPQLRVGVGSPSPHGGTIVRKEIIGLDPARDANGQDHPNMVIPRLRVYVKTDKGEEKYYDAPITKRRSGDPDDPVVAMDITRAMDWMGNLGTLIQAAQNPMVAEKLMNGARGAGAQAQKYLDELTLLGRPARKTTSRERVDLGDRVLEREVDPTTGKVLGEKEMKKGAVPRTFRPGGGGSGGGGARGALQAKLDEIDRMVEDEEISPEDGTEMRKSAVAGIKPATAKAPNAKEVSDDEQAAVNAVASRLGLDYDPNSKSYRSRDGKPMTPEQKEKLGAARAAIQAAARKAAGGGKRASPEELAGAANNTSKPAKTVKWGDLK